MMTEEIILPYKVYYAQALLAMPNLAYMELDSTGLDDHAQLCRFTLLDRDLREIEDILVCPSCAMSPDAAAANGLKREELMDKPMLNEVWWRIQNALRGRYVLYFSKFDLELLKREAKRIEWAPAAVVGADLQALAARYYSLNYPKLSDICASAGYQLPARPRQTALHRAAGQQAILRAMAYPPEPEESPEDDEHPF